MEKSDGFTIQQANASGTANVEIDQCTKQSFDGNTGMNNMRYSRELELPCRVLCYPLYKGYVGGIAHNQMIILNSIGNFFYEDVTGLAVFRKLNNDNS